MWLQKCERRRNEYLLLKRKVKKLVKEGKSRVDEKLGRKQSEKFWKEVNGEREEVNWLI